MNTHAAYIKSVIMIVAEHTGVDEANIKPESNLRADIGIDSLDEIELLMAYEQQYNIDISDEDAEDLKTINDVVAYLEKRVGVAEG